MKKIAVTGGKGGVGKSTIACLLANQYRKENKKVVLVDLDIECPNDYLLLNQQLNEPIESIEADFPKLNKEKCNKCGKCVEVCEENAVFQPKGEHPQFFGNLCSACGACRIGCPNNAIEVEKKEIGWLYKNKIDNDFLLFTGRAKAGLEETGPVVDRAKRRVLKEAEKRQADLVILDTAAGLHCPVITALLGVDSAFLVAEPTPLGVHDLKLIASLVEKLDIKAEIIVNQSDMGSLEKIEKISKDKNIPIKEKIPYSRKITEYYSKAKLKNLSLKEAV